MHVHVIPRYAGDMEDPRGGVRGVIPERRGYWRGAGDHLPADSHQPISTFAGAAKTEMFLTVVPAPRPGYGPPGLACSNPLCFQRLPAGCGARRNQTDRLIPTDYHFEQYSSVSQDRFRHSGYRTHPPTHPPTPEPVPGAMCAFCCTLVLRERCVSLSVQVLRDPVPLRAVWSSRPVLEFCWKPAVMLKESPGQSCRRREVPSLHRRRTTTRRSIKGLNGSIRGPRPCS